MLRKNPPKQRARRKQMYNLTGSTPMNRQLVRRKSVFPQPVKPWHA
jgi:hypothetical protein